MLVFLLWAFAVIYIISLVIIIVAAAVDPNPKPNAGATMLFNVIINAGLIAVLIAAAVALS